MIVILGEELNGKKEKDRLELEIYLKQEGELDGLKIIEGKTFR